MAYLARELARKGFLIVTAGGPGLMEAAHVGVAFSSTDDDNHLENAIAILSQAPVTPALDGLFDKDGSIKGMKRKSMVVARNWLAKALKAREVAPSVVPVSLAVSSWLHGAKSTTPFATHHAKYFRSSLGNEPLIQCSRAGIIYGRGGGGTMSEMMKDIGRAYYAKKLHHVTPMIFFDREAFWSRTAEFDEGLCASPGMKLDDAIRNVLKFGLRSRGFSSSEVSRCIDDRVKFTADVSLAVLTVQDQAAESKRNMSFALGADPLMLNGLRMNHD
jgi:predicted Rossmann-fold nucleotide-binding protein